MVVQPWPGGPVLVSPIVSEQTCLFWTDFWFRMGRFLLCLVLNPSGSGSVWAGPGSSVAPVLTSVGENGIRHGWKF